MYYGEALNDLTREHQKQLRHAKSCAPIFPVVRELAEQFWSEHIYEYGESKKGYKIVCAFGIGTIQGIALDLYLGTENTIKDVHLFVDEIEGKENFEFVSKYISTQYDKSIHLTYRFLGSSYINYFNNTLHPQVLFRFYLDNSKACKLEKTVKTVDEFKLVCD